MDAKTLKALNGSIEKWKKICEGTGEDRSRGNCPLCKSFFDDIDHDGHGCKDCPVKIKTGKSGCGKTPYSKWTNHHMAAHSTCGGKVECFACFLLARAELRFLKSLLPKVKK